MLSAAENSRYSIRPLTNRQNQGKWQAILYNVEAVNERGFLSLFRMSRPSFFNLLNLLNQKNQNLVPVHLLSFLKLAGTCGNDASATKIGMLLGIGYGTVLNYVEAVMTPFSCSKMKSFSGQMLKRGAASPSSLMKVESSSTALVLWMAFSFPLNTSLLSMEKIISPGKVAMPYTASFFVISLQESGALLLVGQVQYMTTEFGLEASTSSTPMIILTRSSI